MKNKEFIKGADLSSLAEVELCGAKFYDGGEELDAMTILHRHGVNLVRLRLWNDPYAEDGSPYGAGCNDLSRTVELARRAKALGMKWMLDFHYSDFWADPGKQIMPKAWRGLDLQSLAEALCRFTKETLEALRAEDLSPDVVAVGNEITNGMLWPLGKSPENFDGLVTLLNSGIRAVRETSPDADIMLHLDNGGKNELYRFWFDNYFERGGEDFDVMGLSYYPFWHGTMADLRRNMNDVADRYGKDLVVVETSMGFSLDDYAALERLNPAERKGFAATEKLASGVEYPMTPEGQTKFLADLTNTIKNVPEGRGRGFVYWEPAWVPIPGSHWSLPAGLEYTGEKGPGGNEWANQALFDYEGHALPALYSIEKL